MILIARLLNSKYVFFTKQFSIVHCSCAPDSRIYDNIISETSFVFLNLSNLFAFQYKKRLAIIMYFRPQMMLNEDQLPNIIVFVTQIIFMAVIII